MEATLNYSEKLRDPRWQQARLKIFERDDWTCQLCGGTETTLAVHHRYYESGREPWDYPQEAFLTVCEICHAGERDERRQAEGYLLRVLGKSGADFGNLDRLASALDKKGLLNENQWQFLHIAIEESLATMLGDGEDA